MTISPEPVRTTQPTEEAAAVAAARGGDRDAFAALCERYRRQLHVHCYRMLGSVDDADDLVQDTYLKAWQARASFEGRCAVQDVALPHRDERVPRRAGAPSEACHAARRPAARTGPEHRLRAARRPAVAPAVPRPAAGGAGSGARRAVGRGRGARDDRAGLPRRHPAPAAAPAGGADPARRDVLVGQGDRRVAGPQRGRRQQPAAARAGDDADEAARTALRVDTGTRDHRRRARPAAPLHRGVGGRRRHRVQRAPRRRRPTDHAAPPDVVGRKGARRRAQSVLPRGWERGRPACRRHRRQPAAGGRVLPSQVRRDGVPADRPGRPDDPGRPDHRDGHVRPASMPGLRPAGGPRR